MHTRSRALTLVLACSLLTVAAGDALAKKPRSHVTAIANGKRFRASKLGITAVSASTGFSIGGSTKPKRGLTRAVTASCLADLSTVTLPATFTCYGSYTETRKRTADFRQWTGDMTVVVETIDGNRIGGTFTAVLASPSSANPTDTAATIEGGRFSVELLGLGV